MPRVSRVKRAYAASPWGSFTEMGGSFLSSCTRFGCNGKPQWLRSSSFRLFLLTVSSTILRLPEDTFSDVGASSDIDRPSDERPANAERSVASYAYSEDSAPGLVVMISYLSVLVLNCGLETSFLFRQSLDKCDLVNGFSYITAYRETYCTLLSILHFQVPDIR